MSTSDDSPSMALVVRKDLGLSAGKMAVQCAHCRGLVHHVLGARSISHALMDERWRQCVELSKDMPEGRRPASACSA